ncbi:MAG: hypothetical protein IKO94_00150, partial [Selenomonadaceae bacterium]|nr:hypothetical protein [Selenomonadaceae bacterium]
IQKYRNAGVQHVSRRCPVDVPAGSNCHEDFVIMVSFRKKKQVNSDGIHLLASILVCFSEITTISYEPEDESLKITFTLQKMMKQEDFDALTHFLAESIHTYHVLEGYLEGRVDFSMETHHALSFLHMTRDIATVSRGEFSLVVSIIKERFKEALLVDRHEYGPIDPEFAAAQEETLDRMLGNIRSINLSGRLVGLREGDHVVVFDR